MGPSNAQHIADCVIRWSHENRVQLNSDKYKELRISFSKKPSIFDPVVEKKELKIVDSVKLLGVTISSNLTWNDHIVEITKRVSKRLYFLTQLKRARIPPQDLVLFCKSCIRSVIDYAIPIFYHMLPQYLKNELVRLEKRAISIITSGSYTEAQVLGITPILDHYNYLCSKLFNSIIADQAKHKLGVLLPSAHQPVYNTRKQRFFSLPHLKTN